MNQESDYFETFLHSFINNGNSEVIVSEAAAFRRTKITYVDPENRVLAVFVDVQVFVSNISFLIHFGSGGYHYNTLPACVFRNFSKIRRVSGEVITHTIGAVLSAGSKKFFQGGYIVPDTKGIGFTKTCRILHPSFFFVFGAYGVYKFSVDRATYSLYKGFFFRDHQFEVFRSE